MKGIGIKVRNLSISEKQLQTSNLKLETNLYFRGMYDIIIIGGGIVGTASAL
jgi:hypothetical protein